MDAIRIAWATNAFKPSGRMSLDAVTGGLGTKNTKNRSLLGCLWVKHSKENKEPASPRNQRALGGVQPYIRPFVSKYVS